MCIAFVLLSLTQVVGCTQRMPSTLKSPGDVPAVGNPGVQTPSPTLAARSYNATVKPVIAKCQQCHVEIRGSESGSLGDYVRDKGSIKSVVLNLGDFDSSMVDEIQKRVRITDDDWSNLEAWVQAGTPADNFSF